MLALMRKEGESVIIGDNHVRIVVLTAYGKVRLGFSAPDDVSIHREEVFLTIKKTGSEGRKISDGLLSLGERKFEALKEASLRAESESGVLESGEVATAHLNKLLAFSDDEWRTYLEAGKQ